MPRRLFPLFAVLLVTPVFAADPPPVLAAIDKQVDTHADDLLNLYTHLHSHPELSLQEKESAARMAAELEKLG
ncbi:MAG: amidohydrolase, partial [Armatimonadaceae bacterium]